MTTITRSLSTSGLAWALGLALFASACHHGPDLKKPDGCASVPAVVLPIDQSKALVEEDQYKHYVGEVANELLPGLRDRLTARHKFQKVELGSACTGGVRIETRVVSLIHHHRKFHYKVAGRVVECGTDRVLHTFENEEDNGDIAGLADSLADDITDEVADNVICTPPAHVPARQ